MNFFKRSMGAFVVMGLLCGPLAFAARNAKVITDQAKVFEFPRPDSQLIGTVIKDLSIQVSNSQTNGFFKSRIPGGKIGWISGSDVFVTTPEPSPEQLKDFDEKKKEGSAASLLDRKGRIRLQLTGGIHQVSFSGMPSGIDASDATSALGGSLEVQYALSSSIFAAGRAGYLSTSGSVVRLTSLPLQFGLSWVPISGNVFRFGMGVYGGVGLLTTFSIEKNDKLSEYASTGMIGTGNVQASIAISKRLAILLDVDYRLHSINAPASTDPLGLQLPEFTAGFGGLAGRLGFEIRI
jgi:hypothetical protein